ncbi:UNVERIFIED_CONTAM: hypothetical protein Sradi_3005700 [Sesamum radiatum]|uniref:Uncharacterized protein n=1 Tax=Sesamum radiatum TaxID=300843 RepID=A0AAW2S116_SESRA
MEKELRRLSKGSAEHEKILRQAVEKVVADYPNSEEGRFFWRLTGPASWTNIRSLKTSKRRWLRWPFPS